MNPTLIAFSLALFSTFSSIAAFSQSASPSGSAVQPAAMKYSVQGNSEGASGQAGMSAQGGAPVSYGSMTQLNGLLSQLEAASKAAQADLAKLRVEKWKTDGNSKKQSLANVDSVKRNLQEALPEIISQLQASPENLPATFKLYRNLDALYDVLGGVVESAGAFGPKDDFQSLSNDLNTFEASRRSLAERLESLATSKEAEIGHLRTELKTAQAALPAAAPQKTIVDDTAPAKKPAKKKPAAKKPPAAAPAQPAQTPPPQ